MQYLSQRFIYFFIFGLSLVFPAFIYFHFSSAFLGLATCIIMIAFSLRRFRYTIYKINLDDSSIHVFPIIGSAKIFSYRGLEITLEKTQKSHYIPSDKLIIHRHICDAKYWPKDVWQKMIEDIEVRMKNDV